MATQITRTQYLKELNDRLQAHPDFAPGMRFVPFPGLDPELATGYDWEPKNGAAPPLHLFVAISHEVAALYFV
jgi:hypothetical protein